MEFMYLQELPSRPRNCSYRSKEHQNLSSRGLFIKEYAYDVKTRVHWEKFEPYEGP